jgi:acetyltransferase-like isoleucine patch superfamily enzyme
LIGYNAHNYGRVTIGDGAIIALQNATVVKKCEPYTIVGGIQQKSLENDFQKTYKVIMKWNWR